MSVLLLRLVGPMQSWGVQSRFSVRDTGREPSKSGVVGLLCAALGRPRTEPVADLAALRMGVRVDREGRLARDYHTALTVAKAGGGTKECEPSARYYLADAAFLVGLDGDRGLLERLDAALRSPVWPLSLGRKSFLPGEPIPLDDTAAAVSDEKLEGVLRAYPVFKTYPPPTDEPYQPRFVMEVPYGQGEPVMDQPVSFATRTFHVRHVRHVTAKGD